VVLTTLPIAVNVEDFFRGNRLFSKFTVATTTHQHVRIRSAELSVPDEGELDGITVKGCTPKGRGSVVSNYYVIGGVKIVNNMYRQSRLQTRPISYFASIRRMGQVMRILSYSKEMLIFCTSSGTFASQHYISYSSGRYFDLFSLSNIDT
jgi:hypothetical protein